MKFARLAAVAGVATLLAAPALAQDDPTPPQPAEGAEPPNQDTPPLPETQPSDTPSADAPSQDAAPAEAMPSAADSATSQMSPATSSTAAPSSDASTWKAGDPGITSNQPVPNPPEKPRRTPRH